MAKPSWNKKLSEVLGYPTQEITKISPKTEKEYTTDAVPILNVFSTGEVTETEDGKFRYSIIDPTKKLDYEIKVSNKIEVKFGITLCFKNVVGGSLEKGRSWYGADSVEVVKRNV